MSWRSGPWHTLELSIACETVLMYASSESSTSCTGAAIVLLAASAAASSTCCSASSACNSACRCCVACRASHRLPMVSTCLVVHVPANNSRTSNAYVVHKSSSHANWLHGCRPPSHRCSFGLGRRAGGLTYTFSRASIRLHHQAPLVRCAVKEVVLVGSPVVILVRLRASTFVRPCGCLWQTSKLRRPQRHCHLATA